jgi:alginate O-acetyltransferase complex protein AlgI
MFPQLIAGPIVRYSDIAEELDERKITLEKISYGINRFVIGLGKKVLIANVLGEFCNIVKTSKEQSVVFIWAYAIAYALHIYFDFSGYSDMGIGIGRALGFHFPENFNYPYISKSITEFWRRWHMTLGTWFKDYVYIPLGGNRVSKIKWLRNILIVWALTGLWHGASWNFVIWGLMFGILLVIEKFFLYKWLEKIPSIFSRLYVLIIVLISWIIFDAATMGEITSRLSIMFGFGNVPFINSEAIYYIKSYLGIFVMGLIGATPAIKLLVEKLKNTKISNMINILEPIMHIFLLILVTAYLVDGSFNPFLYFRF